MKRFFLASCFLIFPAFFLFKDNPPVLAQRSTCYEMKQYPGRPGKAFNMISVNSKGDILARSVLSEWRSSADYDPSATRYFILRPHGSTIELPPTKYWNLNAKRQLVGGIHEADPSMPPADEEGEYNGRDLFVYTDLKKEERVFETPAEFFTESIDAFRIKSHAINERGETAACYDLMEYVVDNMNSLDKRSVLFSKKGTAKLILPLAGSGLANFCLAKLFNNGSALGTTIGSGGLTNQLVIDRNGAIKKLFPPHPSYKILVMNDSGDHVFTDQSDSQSENWRLFFVSGRTGKTIPLTLNFPNTKSCSTYFAQSPSVPGHVTINNRGQVAGTVSCSNKGERISPLHSFMWTPPKGRKPAVFKDLTPIIAQTVPDTFSAFVHGITSAGEVVVGASKYMLKGDTRYTRNIAYLISGTDSACRGQKR